MRPEEPDLTCERAESRFSAALEGDLSEAEGVAFRAHLESCPKCEAGFERFEKAVGALRTYEVRPLPRTFLEAMREATREEVRPLPRKWPLLLAWATAAAAVVAAVFALLTRPRQVVIRVPVERRVVVKEKVPVPMPVRVPVPTPVKVPLHGGSLEVVREDTILVVATGDFLELHEGDVVRVPRAVAPPPVRIPVNLAPLAEALCRTANAMNRMARSMADATVSSQAKARPRPLDRTLLKPEAVKLANHGRPAREPPVMLVQEPGGILVLETSGPVHEVIPELLSLLDSRSTLVSAVAQGRLESIQDRLFREHGITGHRESPPGDEASGGLKPLREIFGGAEDRPREERPSERWRRWWATNREPILCLARHGAE